MTNKSAAEYISRAHYHINQHLPVDYTLNDVANYLEDKALDAMPKRSWSTLRYAFKQFYKAKGMNEEVEVIAAIKYPKNMAKPRTKKRVKKVSEDDFKKLFDYCAAGQTQYDSLLAALAIFKLTGCRPAELLSIELRSNSRIFIVGAKKTEDGLRGADREITLSKANFKFIEKALAVIKQEQSRTDVSSEPQKVMKRLQRKLETITRKIWQKRTSHITFYSFRHQMGSDLKGSDKDRREVAAFMGHQSVDSIDKYGDRRSAKRLPYMNASQQSIDNVRVTQVKGEKFLKRKRWERAHPELISAGYYSIKPNGKRPI